MADLENQIKVALEAFWDEHALTPVSGGASTVDELLEPIESMTAVEVLATLDKIVGAKLPNSVIQTGGYKTKEEFVNQLSAKVLAHQKAPQQ
ncbi:hypothetical protein DOT66_25415 [Ralstonia pseudosolanacearum]|uniref:hypothetical protein n=1 Tax=Ralstonia pseudosolanacearum TaxID=1310165 RepID=UPI000DAE646E|nr:hypothetical protein [Ralstonia pseudosolanacearum]MCK4136111.1 hypothetical protein [Ralstonia pseudosolanacearum]RAA04390.1 hypothetical protein DOT66_25415 [Ralstonia pseudosolanacearum]UQY82596.1 hypothetical protein JNO62_00055 [Ralstonia pseudosolanacearum]